MKFPPKLLKTHNPTELSLTIIVSKSVNKPEWFRIRTFPAGHVIWTSFCHNHRHFKSNTCVDIPQVIRHKSLVSRCANKNGIQQWPPAEFDRVWIAHLEVYTKKAPLSLRDLFGWWRKYDLDYNLLTLYDLRTSFDSEELLCGIIYAKVHARYNVIYAILTS